MWFQTKKYKRLWVLVGCRLVRKTGCGDVGEFFERTIARLQESTKMRRCDWAMGRWNVKHDNTKARKHDDTIERRSEGAIWRTHDYARRRVND